MRINNLVIHLTAYDSSYWSWNVCEYFFVFTDNCGSDLVTYLD